jgi:hypothetical protein
MEEVLKTSPMSGSSQLVASIFLGIALFLFTAAQAAYGQQQLDTAQDITDRPSAASSPSPEQAASLLTQSPTSLERMRQLTSLTRIRDGGMATPDFSAGFADPKAAKTGVVAISDEHDQTVSVFSASGKVVATITGFGFCSPKGLAADSAGNLYAADTFNAKIKVYKNDFKTLIETIDDVQNNQVQYPTSVAVDSTTGVLADIHIAQIFTGGPGNVAFYAKGQTKPCATVSGSNFQRIYFGGFDANRNLYIDGQDSSGATIVGVISGECSASEIVPLTTKNTILFPGGVKVRSNGQIVIEDQDALALYTYAAPVNGSLGSPIETTLMQGIIDPVDFAFTKGESKFWTADVGGLAGVEFAYPTGGPLRKVDTRNQFQEPVGVAVFPVDLP